MNRRIVALGLIVFLVGVGLLAYPVVTTGVESVDPEVQLGIFTLPVSLAILLWGSAAPDPSVTTVGGLFGNADENEMRRRESRTSPTAGARFLPHPLESVNCRGCYTAIAAVATACPRCGRVRTCRGCDGELTATDGFPRCGRCRRLEVFCDCPKVKSASPLGGLARRAGRLR